jgi:serine O-acetyltransferase
MDSNQLWQEIVKEAQAFAASEALLSDYLHQTLIQQPGLSHALSQHLARLLANHFISEQELQQVILSAFEADRHIVEALCRDIEACRERDAACNDYLVPVLYFKGFHALLCYRVAHFLYTKGLQGTPQPGLAFFFQNLMSQLFGVDIHPAAKIGSGIMIDHATGVVVGETAVVEDDVSMLHGVTLGGTGVEHGCDRHPKIRRGVLLSTGAKVLGCIEVGEGAKVGAGSLVLEDVPPHTTVAGIPARVVGRPAVESPALSMDHKVDEEDGS